MMINLRPSQFSLVHLLLVLAGGCNGSSPTGTQSGAPTGKAEELPGEVRTSQPKTCTFTWAAPPKPDPLDTLGDLVLNHQRATERVVAMRQVAMAGDGVDRQKTFELLDAELEAALTFARVQVFFDSTGDDRVRLGMGAANEEWKQLMRAIQWGDQHGVEGWLRRDEAFHLLAWLEAAAHDESVRRRVVVRAGQVDHAEQSRICSADIEDLLRTREEAHPRPRP